MRGYGLETSGSVEYPVTGPCEHGNTLFSSIKAGEIVIFDQLSNYKLFIKNSALWS
jgi:hypothetical protein